MKVAIGSTNPVKLQAAKEAFGLLFPDETIEYIQVECTSNVSEQPLSDQESLSGALNRAQEAIKGTTADYGVGLEGGLSQVDGRWFTGTAAAVVDSHGVIGLGFGPRVLTPPKTLHHIDAGNNLSEALAKSHGVQEAGKKQGLFGIVTHGLITRASSSRDAVITAAAPFLSS